MIYIYIHTSAEKTNSGKILQKEGEVDSRIISSDNK